MKKSDNEFFIQQQINKTFSQIIEEQNTRINNLENLNESFDVIDVIGLSMILNIVFVTVIYSIFIK